MKATSVKNPPKIDGKLNDPAWQEAQFSGDFLQREPNEGEPATEKTEVAIVYDSKNLYLAARCYDAEPDRIRATEMRRDAFLYQDDYFSIILDTFHDMRNAFYFETNPLGVRRDGTISDEGKIQNSNWDGVWQCKTSIDEQGWYLEIAIPWQTLRFREGDNIVWGANFVRRIQRKNEDDYWRLIPRYAGWNGRYRMSEAGKISGFNNLKMGGIFEFKPFTTAGVQRDEFTGFSTKTVKDAGIDLKINLTSKMTMDLTYNTDFAQVEADQERVNLTRFSLYFPEKRDFFLEGAETFTFGQTRGHSWRPEAGDIQLFHSRRIGIAERQPVPIIGGARLNGKMGKYTIGLMSIQSDNTTIETSDDEQKKIPATNFSVFRLKRNLFSRSSAGIMLLNKQEADGSFNRSFGFDSNFPVDENFSFYFAGAGSYSSVDTTEGNRNDNNLAVNLGFNWESDLWEFRASFLDIEENFNPEMGFIRRTDIRRTQGRMAYSPRPQQWQSIRQLEFGIGGQYQTDHENRLLNRKLTTRFEVRFENSASVNLDISNEYEYIEWDWEVREGYLIPRGGYSNTEYRLRFHSDRSRKISGRVNFNAGDYYTGNRIGGGVDADFKAFTRFNANLDVNYNFIKLPDGQFHTTTVSTRLIYSISPDFFIKAYLQLYDDKLSNDGKNRVSGNIILRYIYRPGSDFYLVYNQESLIGPGHNVVKNRTIMAKLTYFLRR